MNETRENQKDRSAARVETFYEALLEAHEGLDLEQCLRMHVRLILDLAARVGDPAVLAEALASARDRAK